MQARNRALDPLMVIASLREPAPVGKAKPRPWWDRIGKRSSYYQPRGNTLQRGWAHYEATYVEPPHKPGRRLYAGKRFEGGAVRSSSKCSQGESRPVKRRIRTPRGPSLAPASIRCFPERSYSNVLQLTTPRRRLKTPRFVPHVRVFTPRYGKEERFRGRRKPLPSPKHENPMVPLSPRPVVQPHLQQCRDIRAELVPANWDALHGLPADSTTARRIEHGLETINRVAAHQAQQRARQAEQEREDAQQSVQDLSMWTPRNPPMRTRVASVYDKLFPRRTTIPELQEIEDASAAAAAAAAAAAEAAATSGQNERSKDARDAGNGSGNGNGARDSVDADGCRGGGDSDAAATGVAASPTTRASAKGKVGGSNSKGAASSKASSGKKTTGKKSGSRHAARPARRG